jgi:hypothetical protein
MTLAYGIGLFWCSVMIAGTAMVDSKNDNKTHCYSVPLNCVQQCLKWQHAHHADHKEGVSPCFSMCDQPSLLTGWCWHEWPPRKASPAL